MFNLCSIVFLAWLLMMAVPVSADEKLIADPLRPLSGDVLPTIPLSGMGSAQGMPIPRLSMIVHHGHHAYAVIDGVARQAGAEWSGYRLLAIRPSSVLLATEGGDPLELTLVPAAVSKKPARFVEGNVRP